MAAHLRSRHDTIVPRSRRTAAPPSYAPELARVAVALVACLGCGTRAAPSTAGAGGDHAGNGALATADGGGSGRSAGATPVADASEAAAGSGPRAADGGRGNGGSAVDAGSTTVPAQADARDAGPAPRVATRRIDALPTYRGSVDNAATCTHDYALHGFEPDTPQGARHPLLLYFSGTNFVLDAAAFQAQVAPGADAVTEAMARRGFVALQVEYDNGALSWASDHSGLLGCLFGGANPQNVVAVACALPQVDCDLGIATWGHSLGAFVAHSAANTEARVRAVWATGYGGDATTTLSPHRFRVVNGENDTTNGTVATLDAVAGFSAAECPDDGRSECLRSDGSGWIIVRAADCQLTSADHCWFDQLSCLDGNTTLEPNFVDPASTKAFALEPNADWVAATARTP